MARHFSYKNRYYKRFRDLEGYERMFWSELNNIKVIKNESIIIDKI